MDQRDIVIIGSGPAGCTAAIYAARANRRPLVIAGFQRGGPPGGQLMTTTDIENFPGFPDPMGGAELMERMRKQAEHFGAEFIQQDVSKVDLSGKPLRLWLDEQEIQARTLIISTGAGAKRLGTEAETRFWNKGISACATCDGALPLFRNQPLAVIGGGDTAMEEALFLARFGSQVTIIHRHDNFRASQIMLQRAQKNPKINWKTFCTLEGTEGTDTLETLILRQKDGRTEKLPVRGLFLAIGHHPNTELFKPALKTDAAGYLLTDGHTRTQIPGVFAAGDCVDHIYRQAVTAAGEGCMAAIQAEHYLESEIDRS